MIEEKIIDLEPLFAQVSGWCDFVGTEIVLKKHELLEGNFTCARCGKKGVQAKELWKHTQEHIDEIYLEEREMYPLYDVVINEDSLECIFNDETGVGEIFVIPTLYLLPSKKTKLEFRRAKPGNKKENIGRTIQHLINDEGLPDIIKLWRTPSGKYTIQFGDDYGE